MTMHPVQLFELVIGMLVVVLALNWLAGRLGWPPSIALLIGGGALAFLPGIPTIRLDPDLVLVVFLPPLLMDGAWYTALARFKRHFIGILSLAVGAVVFTTFVVAIVTHLLMPALPWAACAALGAILSPPDAVSARSILQRVRLPRRLSTLLEGESLLNDATGLVIFRFAVAAAVGGGFDAGEALGQFVMLTAGGVLVGLGIGFLWVKLARHVNDELTLVVISPLASWVSYLVGETFHVSGVIATVSTGLFLGWHQHTVLPASVRIRGTAFWVVLVFLLEASVFILIGFSLRDIISRAGGFEIVITEMAVPLLIIVLTLTASRFAWIFASDLLLHAMSHCGFIKDTPLGRPARMVMSWAGMRGVVTLAVALTLPDDIPGRDFMVLTAFGVILATVVIQGSTLGIVIRLAGIKPAAEDAPPMDIFEAEAALAKAQLAAVEELARDSEGNVLHPRLLDQFTNTADIAANYSGTVEDRERDIRAHYDTVLAAVSAGRAELVRLHRSNKIDDEILHSLERDLDLQELTAISAKE